MCGGTKSSAVATEAAPKGRTGAVNAAVRADQCYPLFWVYLRHGLNAGYWLKRGSVRIAVLPSGSNLSRSMHRLLRHSTGVASARPELPRLDRTGLLMRLSRLLHDPICFLKARWAE